MKSNKDINKLLENKVHWDVGSKSSFIRASIYSELQSFVDQTIIQEIYEKVYNPIYYNTQLNNYQTWLRLTINFSFRIKK